LSPLFERFQEANALYFAGKVPEACSLLERLVRDAPNMVEAQNLLAYAYADTNRMEDAMRAAKRALELSPTDGMVLDTVGEMHEKRREFERAVRYYEAALAAPPTFDNIETHCKLGRTLVMMGRRTEAVPHLRYAAERGPSQWAAQAAQLLQNLGEKPASPHRRQDRTPPAKNTGNTRSLQE
jgi:tetratricopeptide (TPR) repeat protein